MKITICLNTWRLGTLDSVISSLEAQQLPDDIAFDTDVELVIADELHRWRAEAVQDRLAQCPFSVKHLPVERSLFPVCSTMRAGNTCIRNADPSSELLVHVCDGAVLPPNFLAEHWAAYLRDPKAIGIAPYRGRTMKVEAWTLPTMDAWDMVEACMCIGRSQSMWTAFNARGQSLSALPLDIESICEPLDPTHPQGGSPALAETGTKPGDVVTEWFAHYKVDAVPLAAYRAVNGWDEEYDGGYIYADIDMSLRLQAAGYTPRVIGYNAPVEVPILDFHRITKRSPDVAFRQHHMASLLSGTKARLKSNPRAFACIEGLSRPLRSHAHDGFRIAGPQDTVSITVQRPWLLPGVAGERTGRTGGRIDLVTTPENAFIWARIVPPVLYGWKPLEAFLGETAGAGSGKGPWASVVLRSLQYDLDAGAASLAQHGRLLFVGREDDANELIGWADAHGWSCEAKELENGVCGVMTVKP